MSKFAFLIRYIDIIREKEDTVSDNEFLTYFRLVKGIPKNIYIEHFYIGFLLISMCFDSFTISKPIISESRLKII